MNGNRHNWGRHWGAHTPTNDVPAFYAKAPDVHRAFDRNRDPYVAKQLEDLDKTERERREESQGRSSGMVGKDKPGMAFTPPEEIRKAVTRSKFNRDWVREQYDAAMKNADLEHQRMSLEQGYQQSRQQQGPERSR